MTRFQHLEFDDERQRAREAPTTGPLIDAQHHFREAEERWREGRFEKALRSYGRALEHNPAMAEAWVGQVRMLLELGDAKEARLWADKALEQFRSHPDLMSAKAVALARMGSPDEAMKLSDAALAQQGETAWVWTARGEVLLARGQRNEEFCFAKAVALGPKYWWLRVVVARAYMTWHAAAVALKWLREAIALHAGSAYLWTQIGECQLALSMPGEARSSYVNAMALDADAPGAREAIIAVDAEEPASRLWRRITDFFKRKKP